MSKLTIALEGEKKKNCIHCGSAQDTAKLWKIKCSEKRHSFQENKRICENCGKKRGLTDFRNWGVVTTLCEKCADIPMERLTMKFVTQTSVIGNKNLVIKSK